MSRALALIFFACFMLLSLGCDPGASRAASSGEPSSTSSAAIRPTAKATDVAAPTEDTTAASIKPLPKGAPLRIGVTLHPYYSWTKNVVGDSPGVEVRSILPGEVDAGNYQPRPDDIEKLADLDAIVVNGIGHDDFIGDMIKASGNTKLVVIRPNDGTPTIRAMHGGSVNSHTFISFTNAIQQTYAIQKALSALRPDLADRFQTGASEYAQRLRKIKADAASKLAGAKITRVVTVHDGYSYLCQEFGIEVAGVVEPAHGLVPSAQELGAMVDLIKREKIQVVLSEETFPDKLLGVLRESAKVKVFVITHIASGEYTADKFENEMKKNADTLIQALVTGQPKTVVDHLPLLEAFDVTVASDEQTILDGVSLSVSPRSIHVIVGPNGAGKSTLIAALLGQTHFSGSVRCHFRGSGRIGFVPQTFAVDPSLPVTVMEFLALPRQRLPVCFGVRRATRAHVTRLLERVGLAALGARRLGALSGGELRRVLLANALDPEPELLVLDEPGSGLDEASSRRMEEILLGLREKTQTAILLVSHDLGQVRRLADKVTLLDRRVVRVGLPDDVLSHAVLPFPASAEAR